MILIRIVMMMILETILERGLVVRGRSLTRQFLDEWRRAQIDRVSLLPKISTQWHTLAYYGWLILVSHSHLLWVPGYLGWVPKCHPQSSHSSQRLTKIQLLYYQMAWKKSSH